MACSLSLVSEGDCIYLNHDVSCVLVLSVPGKQKNLRPHEGPEQSHPSTAHHPLRLVKRSHQWDMDLKSNMQGKEYTNVAHEMSCMPRNIYVYVEPHSSLVEKTKGIMLGFFYRFFF